MRIGSTHSLKLSFTECLNRMADPQHASRSAEEVADSVSFSEALDLVKPETDRVTDPKRVNPASDALTLNIIDKIPKSLAKMTSAGIRRWVTHGSVAKEQVQQEFTPGQEAPIHTSAFVETLQAGMNDFPDLKPHIGPEHVWSKESKPHRGFGYFRRAAKSLVSDKDFPFPTLGRSKLLCALGSGSTAVVMPTGREEPLKEWVLEQEKGSVQIDTLFKESYRLNEGDLYGTLLTAENVLSEGLYKADRSEQEVTKKLSYIRNDSAPAGDNFGSWYHLFGSALYALVRPEWKAKVSMKIEDLGSLILEGSDPQEDHINQLGIRMGSSLKKIAQNGVDQLAKVKDYINRSEFAWSGKNVALFNNAPSKA